MERMPQADEATQTQAVNRSLLKQDPLGLVRALSLEEISRLELAEKVLELEHNRRRRTSPLGSILPLVAFGGLLVNAFQSYNSSQTQQKIREADQKRWAKEFERAKAADRYNAFLATSALATDSTNPDKRLVGYALLQEFVDDRDYNAKSTLMLEQALFDELDRDTTEGLSEEHRNSVTAILGALSGTSDCAALAGAVRSVGRIAKRNAKSGDLAEAQEVFRLYVRRLYGRAAEVCKKPEDFLAVQRPLRQSLMVAPELGQLPKGKTSAASADRNLAATLIEDCQAEMAVTALNDCEDILRGYEALCQGGLQAKEGGEACALVHAAAATLPPPPKLDRKTRARLDREAREAAEESSDEAPGGAGGANPGSYGSAGGSSPTP